MKRRVLILIFCLSILGMNDMKISAGETRNKNIIIEEIKGYIPAKNIKNVEVKNRVILKDGNRYPIINKVHLNFGLKTKEIFMYNGEIGIKYENEELRIIKDKKYIEIVKAKDKKKLLENSNSSSVIIMG